MPYTDRFTATDNLILHLSTFVHTIPDPAIQANYAGFLSVSSVTVFELAIKDIFIEFASSKNKVLGTVINKYFEKLNGRIQLADLRGTHIKLFGEKYLKKFDKKLKIKDNIFFASHRVIISTEYSNLITCRHQYVHKGSPTLSISEVINYYLHGKEVIQCLSEAMRR